MAFHWLSLPGSNGALPLCMLDTRRDYGETREIGFAMLDQRLYVVGFAQRSAGMRIISLRKANSRQVKLYDEAFKKPGVGAADT